MGLSYEQEIERREDEHVKYLAEHVCNKDGDKPYVFISYKSDDWKIVLHDVVYRLVKEYGLNVYFDGDFSGHNPHWTTQFPENMAHPNCRGVLAFIDDLYSTSYATLLELMYSQCSCQDEDNNYEYVRKNVVPVNLVKALAVIKDTADTGLGKTQYFDGERDVKNVKAADEKKLFDEAFERGCELKILKKTKNPYKGELSKKLCSVMVEEVLASIDYNDNPYLKMGDSIAAIRASIENACGSEVFDKADDNDDHKVTNNDRDNDHDNDCDHDNDSVDQTDESTADGYDYTIFGKKYSAGGREQGKLMYDAFAALIEKYPDSAEKLTQRTSVARAEEVKFANTNKADPTYFRRCKSFKVGDQEYLVGTSYGFKDKLAEIKRMFRICGADAGEFILNGEALVDTKGKEAEQSSEGIGYSYTIFGKAYTAGSRDQGKLMYDAFAALVERHPDLVENLTQRTSIARADNVKNPNTKDSDPTYFRGCRSFDVGGREYLVGTSYGFDAKISEIKGMFKICGEDYGEFNITSAPEKSTRGANGKKGLAELL